MKLVLNYSVSTFGAGMTSADFQMTGMYASGTEALNIAAIGSLIRGTIFLQPI